MGQILFPIKDSKYSGTQGRNKKGRPVLINLLFQIVFIGITVFMFYNVGRSVYMASAKLAILDQAEREVEELRLENISLVLQSEEANTDDYVEKQARDRLNYARDGETQCVIPDAVIDSYVNESEKVGEESILGVQSTQSMQAWVDFFIDGI